MTDQPSAHFPARRPWRPSAAWMWPRLSHVVALGMGSGLSPKAPGTVGTLWAWAAYLLIDAWFTPSAAQWGVIIVGALLVGWWASQATVARVGVADPGFIVIDEVVAFWIILWVTMPMGFMGQLAAFGLFRFFDAVKWGPVAWADRVFKGGGWRGAWGIMFDDLVAALLTLLVMAWWVQ